MRRALCSILVVLGLSACSSVVPSTIMRLNALDPFTADPNDMAVALDLPAGLALQENTARMVFTAVHSPSGETWEGDYTLIEERTAEGLVIYTLAPEDVADLNATKQDLTRWKATSDGNSTLSFNVKARSCRVSGVDLDADPRVSILIRFEADGPLRPFVRDASLLEFFDVDNLRDLPPCNGPF